MDEKLSVLVLAEDELGDTLRGPGIRAIGLAKALARKHRVTLAARREAGSHDGLRLVPFRRRALIRELRRCDVVIAPWIPPYLLLAARLLGRRCVADLYDRADIELAHVDARSEQALVQELTQLQLRHADVVLCATRRQGDALRPRTSADVLVVPMGVEPPTGIVGSPGIRDRVAGIGPQDPVVVWWGSVWAWFDAETAVIGFERVLRDHPDAKFVVFGAAPGLAAADRFMAADRVREIAVERGLLNRAVFLVDEWVPWAERHAVLGDADVGICLSRGGDEAAFAARTRLLDHLQAGLPSVLTGGDELSDELAAAGLARLVPPGDAAAAAAAMVAWLDDEEARQSARHAGARLARQYTWSETAQPLLDRLETLVPRRTSLLAAVRDVGRYYARRSRILV